MREFCHTFMEDYSKQRNKPSTQRGYQGVIDRCIVPIMGRMKVQDVKRPDVAALMKKLAYKLASGRYALLDDGMGFSLVPWKPVIENKLGQQIAATAHGLSAEWRIGRATGR
nr:DUF3363 domain-containing protein [Pseudothauera nasutitermitis]